VSFPPFYKVQASRVLTVPASDFVGEKDLLWFDESGILRLGDGVTPGGIPLNFSGAATSSTVYNNFLPGIDNTYNLGSPTNRWKTLYLSSSTFYVGNNTVTIAGTGTILVNGVAISGGSGGGTGFTGSQGDVGFVGSQGIQGPIGYTGSSAPGGGANNLVFSENGDQRILTGFVDPDGETFSVRTTQITNSGTFVINLASFTPIFTGTVLPAVSLNWDQPVTAFKVTVNNPVDFLTKYISSVFSIESLTGFVTTDDSVYTRSGPNVIPDYGVDWEETFFTNANAVVRSTSSSIAGGSASARIKFNVVDISDGLENEYLPLSTTISVSWATPTLSISMSDPTGNTFLQSYTQTSYSVSVTGITNAINYSLSVSSQGGTPSNVTGNGNLIFTLPIHKNNTTAPRTITVDGTFNRPIGVTGSAYSSTLTASDLTLSPAFSYPSIWLWTASVNVIPTVTDIVSGTSFAAGITVLGNQVRTFAATVNNTANVPRVFWFGVRSAATQPTVFQTGVNANLLSGVGKTNATVQLGPSPLPVGYVLETYNLYGIILQPGSTYVNIS
jgi:hypothetical protein